MNNAPERPIGKLNIWVRGLAMLLLGMVFHVCATILFILAIIQFLITLSRQTPHARLALFGRNLAEYCFQIAAFLTFSSDILPFPFGDWPSTDRPIDI